MGRSYTGKRGRTPHFALIIVITSAIILSLLPAASASDSIKLDINFNDGMILNQGAVSTITVTIANTAERQVKLNFVGLRFDWLPGNVYIYGDNSERERVLSPQETAQYRIAFNIPAEVTAGMHTPFVVVTYGVESEDGWTGHNEVVEISPGINVVQVVTITQTEVVTVLKSVSAAGSQLQPNLQTGVAAAAAILLVILIAALGLLRRRRARKATG